jgi:excisionase family DNA binding protein
MARQPLGFAPKEETTAIFVRVPVDEAEKLDRLSFELKQPKRQIVAALLSAVDLDEGRLVLGRADLPTWERDGPADVLTLAELAELLRAEETAVRALVEKGDLPGRKVGGEWRFSRRAVLAWLACE